MASTLHRVACASAASRPDLLPRRNPGKPNAVGYPRRRGESLFMRRMCVAERIKEAERSNEKIIEIEKESNGFGWLRL